MVHKCNYGFAHFKAFAVDQIMLKIRAVHQQG